MAALLSVALFCIGLLFAALFALGTYHAIKWRESDYVNFSILFGIVAVTTIYAAFYITEVSR